MSQEYREKIGITDNHKLVQTDTKWDQRKGQDTDIYCYDEVDELGNVVAKYIVKDSTSIYPPFDRNVSYDKLG